MSGYLKALASPARVLILERLRMAMTSSELRIPVQRRDEGTGRARDEPSGGGGTPSRAGPKR